MQVLLALTVGATVLLASCTSPVPGPPAATPGSPAPAGPSADVAPDAPRYHTTMHVQSIPGTQPPTLCISGDETCRLDDILITNWDWDAVEGEEELFDVVLQGRYYLIGRYDDRAFTVEHAGPPEEAPWYTGDPPEEPLWHCLHRGWRPKTRGVTLTGRYRRCAAPHEYSTRELSKVRDRVERLIERRGLELTWSSEDPFLKHIEIGVLTPDRAVERLVERRWGRGVVKFYPSLLPYPRMPAH